MLNSKSILFCAGAALFACLVFTACGDENIYVTESGNGSMPLLESGTDISKQACDSTNVGAMLFVVDSSAAFVCNGKGWVPLKGADGKDGLDGKNGIKGQKGADGVDGSIGDKGEPGDPGRDGANCTAKALEKDGRLGYVFTCGKNVDTLWSGVDGTPGKSGLAGADGANCTAEEVKKDLLTGYAISCGYGRKDTLWNGVDGIQGEEGVKGKDGDTCQFRGGGPNEIVTVCGEGKNAVSSTIYTSLCGSTPYDPRSNFCLDGVIHDYCHGKVYDPSSEYCSATGPAEMPKCGETSYNSNTHYCQNATDLAEYGLLIDNRARRSQTYKTVVIGKGESARTWMAENLNYDDSSATPNLKGATWCGGEFYMYIDGGCDMYGRLYTWSAAINKAESECDQEDDCNPSGIVQGICPEGWHLPDTAEIKALWNAVGSADVAGKMLKFFNGWNIRNGTYANGTDSYGFSALPAGYIDHEGKFHDEGDRAYFWSSTGSSSDKAYYMFLDSQSLNAALRDDYKNAALSVRCVMD